jgi:hypothetical protein
LICLALVTFSTQVAAQWIQSAEKERVASLMRTAHTGWIKVGRYESGEWKSRTVFIETPPTSVTPGSSLLIAAPNTYFVRIHTEKPVSCDPTQVWFTSTEKNVLPRQTLVHVLEAENFPCGTNGATELWTRVEPEIF